MRTLLAVLAVAAIAAVGLLDYVTGPWMSFAVFYVAPVLGAAWWLGRGPALLASLTAGIAWFEAEAWGHRGESNRTLLWNSMSRLLMLVAMAAMVVRIREDRRRLKRMNARLAELLDAEGKLARTDPLTGVWNRRAFLERLHDELARARRAGSAVCIAALDLDNFKRVNDRFGHPEGDAFLKQVAEALRETIRASDVAARLGGDEFFVLFPDASRDAVESIAHRLVARLRALGAQYDGLDVGASVGMAWFDSAPETAEIAIARTDHALQDAKSAGKHRLLLWTSDAERAIARP